MRETVARHISGLVCIYVTRWRSVLKLKRLMLTWSSQPSPIDQSIITFNWSMLTINQSIGYVEWMFHVDFHYIHGFTRHGCACASLVINCLARVLGALFHGIDDWACHVCIQFLCVRFTSVLSCLCKQLYFQYVEWGLNTKGLSRCAGSSSCTPGESHMSVRMQQSIPSAKFNPWRPPQWTCC